MVRQHAAEVQELSDIIAAVEVRGPYASYGIIFMHL